MAKFLFLYRTPTNPNAAGYQPSPEEMQAQLKQWSDWKATFADAILDMGDGLKPGGTILQTDDTLRDGPFVEAKEVIGGFSIIEADTYEAAAKVARACPVRFVPGNSIEIREMAGF